MTEDMERICTCHLRYNLYLPLAMSVENVRRMVLERGPDVLAPSTERMPKSVALITDIPVKLDQKIKASHNTNRHLSKN
jgi:hypothetical protein